ncbi:transposon protein, putative, CACTA, En/Spm sub-class [Cucumis melo var. makuwa]|uniref:Transposon protein, putative, CACTA, En/Spm sub-class n=1 Tax=Cucumis melo var. makuwa TaxID=1194695 RepID=A0A5A7UUQ7_CUCMM|nr:transposon protein, putative, CACTA, En/Spm sub-class [Cucumis melo var. makuwa]
MFKNLENAKNLRWFAMDRKVDGIMRHPANTPSWRLIDHMWPTFGSEPRNLRLGMKQPRYDINTYLAPLIDDLEILWEEGVRCFDAVKGFKACPISGEEATSIRLQHGKKCIHGTQEILCNAPNIQVPSRSRRRRRLSIHFSSALAASVPVSDFVFISIAVRLATLPIAIVPILHQHPVRVQRGADQRGARRMRKGHMDASGFLYASTDGSLVVVREMPPRRGARRGGRGGRGRGAGRVQPEMREQQQPAPPAPAPVPVVPQVVSNQLLADAKHLKNFRSITPTTFDGSLEDPTRAQLWLSSLETIFRYMKCPKD